MSFLYATFDTVSSGKYFLVFWTAGVLSHFLSRKFKQRKPEASIWQSARLNIPKYFILLPSIICPTISLLKLGPS